jgi:hypothetical protein
MNGNLIENVKQYPHLSHIISSAFSDDDDTIQIRNSFVGQTNDLLCFFNEQDILVKLKLFQSYIVAVFTAANCGL